MLWPIVLPFKIAFWSLAGLVALVTVFSPAFKWKRGKVFLISSILACVAFIPSCTGIMTIIDARRFGVFQYDVYADVNDFQIERYLPTSARNITLDKFAMGHRAKYSIPEADFMEYINGLWNEYGEYSAISRDELSEGAQVTADAFEHEYGDLDWPPLENALEYHSPVQGDGGGATYFFDRDSGTVYHRAGYW